MVEFHGTRKGVYTMQRNWTLALTSSVYLIAHATYCAETSTSNTIAAGSLTNASPALESVKICLTVLSYRVMGDLAVTNKGTDYIDILLVNEGKEAFPIITAGSPHSLPYASFRLEVCRHRKGKWTPIEEGYLRSYLKYRGGFGVQRLLPGEAAIGRLPLYEFMDKPLEKGRYLVKIRYIYERWLKEEQRVEQGFSTDFLLDVPSALRESPDS
jgi:hypothetical protein